MNSSSESSPKWQVVVYSLSSLIHRQQLYSWAIPLLSFCTSIQHMYTCTLTLHKAIRTVWPLTFWIIHETFWVFRILLQTLTISIFINQLKYPVDHLVWGQQIAVLIQLSMAGFLQSIDGLSEESKLQRLLHWSAFDDSFPSSSFSKTKWLYKCEYYLHNFKKLCFINASTPIFIIHFECPLKLMFQFTPQD